MTEELSKKELSLRETRRNQWLGLDGSPLPESVAEREYEAAYKIIMTTRQPCHDRVCRPCENNDFNGLIHCVHCWHCDHCLQFLEVQNSCQCPWEDPDANDLFDIDYDHIPIYKVTLLTSLTMLKRRHGALEYIQGWNSVLESMRDRAKKIQDEENHKTKMHEPEISGKASQE
jgi:hypothetical protein